MILISPYNRLMLLVIGVSILFSITVPLLMALYLKRTDSKIFKSWKYPPKSRTLQFSIALFHFFISISIFSEGVISYSGSFLFFGFILLIISISACVSPRMKYAFALPYTLLGIFLVNTFIQPHFISDYRSHLIGKSFILPAAHSYLTNLSHEKCTDRLCGYKYNTSLEDLTFSGLESKLISMQPPLRVQYVPAGMGFKVVDSFSIRLGLFHSSVEFVVLEDTNGRRSECLEGMVPQYSEAKNDVEKLRIVAALEKIQLEGSFSKEICYSGETRINNAEKIKKVGDSEKKLIELKISRFINDLQFHKEIEVVSKPEILIKDPTSNRKTYDYILCHTLKFKSPEAYLTYVHFLKHWGLDSWRRSER